MVDEQDEKGGPIPASEPEPASGMEFAAAEIGRINEARRVAASEPEPDEHPQELSVDLAKGLTRLSQQTKGFADEVDDRLETIEQAVSAVVTKFGDRIGFVESTANAAKQQNIAVQSSLNILEDTQATVVRAIEAYKRRVSELEAQQRAQRRAIDQLVAERAALAQQVESVVLNFEALRKNTKQLLGPADIVQ